VSISRLTLTNGNAQSGGAILNDGTLTLSEAVVSGNTAAVEGGAILNRGTLHIVASRISWNVAAVGGGIANRDGVVSLLWSTLSHNAAVGPYGGSGGAIASQSGTGDFGGGEARLGLDIRESTISDNSAALKGGAIFLATGLLTMINSTVANNSCSFSGDADACLCAGGGGIYNQLGKAVINSSTLAGNTAFAGGGSITSTYGLTTLKATLLATGSAGPNCVGYSADALKSDGYNLSDDESCVGALTGPGDLNGVPSGLSPMGLQLNGGWFLETIALLPTALLDTVPPEMCPETDQRQMPRPQGGACDVGSYERSAGSIAYSAEIQPPIKADGTSVFGTNRGVIPVKFVLKEYGTPTCQPSSVTIALARLSGPSTGPVSETTYELPADEGNTFRVDRESCQYVYNLSTAVLTPGTYWVSLTFGEVVGTVLFGIR
jgi:hypothetical protein